MCNAGRTSEATSDQMLPQDPSAPKFGRVFKRQLENGGGSIEPPKVLQNLRGSLRGSC